MSSTPKPVLRSQLTFWLVQVAGFGLLLATLALGKSVDGWPAAIIAIVLPAIATIYDSWLFWQNRRTRSKWLPLVFCVLGILWLLLAVESVARLSPPSERVYGCQFLTRSTPNAC